MLTSYEDVNITI